MIRRISLLSKKEDEEEDLFGWEQRSRGIGVLPDITEEEAEVEEVKPSKIAKIKLLTAGVGAGVGATAMGDITLPTTDIPTISVSGMFTAEGIANRLKSKTYRTGETEISELVKPKEITKPEELKMGIDVAMGTWEEQKKANPELQKTEDLAYFLTEVPDLPNFKNQNMSREQSKIAYLYSLLTDTPLPITIKDIQSNLQKYGSINPPKDWKKAWKEEGIFKTALIGPSDKYSKATSLLKGLEDIIIKKESPGADLLSSIGWKGMVLLMGSQVVAGLIDITPEIWRKLSVKIVDKKISFQEGLEAIRKIGEPAAYGEGTPYQRQIFDEAVKRADIQNISIVETLKKGITLTDIQPRFAFGGAKLYAGLPADEIAKSIIEVGKVTAEVVKGLDPIKVSQITQALLNTSPALASEFLKAVEKPGVIPEPAKPTPAEPKEVLKAEVKEPDISKELEPLAEEARKYESFEDFEYAMSKNRPFMKVEPSNELKLKAAQINRITRDSERLSSKDFDGEKNIIVYRTGDSPIKLGDYVYGTKEEAEHALEAGQGEKIYSKKIKANDLIMAGLPSGEYFYSPSKLGFNSLEDFYTQATKPQPQPTTITPAPVVEPAVVPAKVAKPTPKVAPIKVYHGGAGVESLKKSFEILSPEEKQKLPSSSVGLTGLSMTTDKEVAKQYSQNIGQTSEVFEAEINPEAKIYKIDTKGETIDEVLTDNDINKLIDEGYDAIQDTSEEAEKEFRALTNKAIISVAPKAPAISAELAGLAEEARKYETTSEFVKSDVFNKFQKQAEELKMSLPKNLDNMTPEIHKRFKDWQKLNTELTNLQYKAIEETTPKVIEPKIKEIEPPEMDYSLEEDVIKEYGETDIPERAAFITSDGRFIDGGGTRYTDHREMVPDDLDDYMNKTQNIRIVNAGSESSKTEANIDIIYRPTDGQIEAVKQLVEGKTIYGDITGINGNKIASGKFDNFNDWLKWVKEKTHSPDFYTQATAGKAVGVTPTTEKPSAVAPVAEKAMAVPVKAEGKVKSPYDKGGVKLPTPKVKGRLREITGQIPDKIEIAERDILRLVLRGEAKGARKAFAEGKKEGIFTAKEKFAEVVERAKEKKAVRTEIGKIKDILQKNKLRELRPERQKAIKEIIDSIGLQKMTERTKRKLTSRLDFIKDNPDNQIPPEKIAELERLNKKPLSDFTSDDIALIKDSILHEINLNKLKNKIIFGKEIKEAAGELKIARANVLKGKPINKDDTSIIDSGEVEHKSLWQNIMRIWGINSLNPEVICEELDFEDHGVIQKYVYKGIDKGITKKEDVIQKADEWFSKELEGIDISKWSKSFQKSKSDIDFQTVELSSKQELKIPKRKIKITKGERISFLLHERNEKNYAHLAEGGFRFKDNIARKYILTEDNIDEIISSATKEEVKVADAISRFFNEHIKPQLNEASMELNGWEIATEDNYFPINTVALDRRRDALKAQKTFDGKTLEGMGIFKERTNAKNALIIEDAFSITFKHLEQTSSYIGLAKPLRYAKLLLEDTEFQENVLKTKGYGKDYINNLKKYLKEIEDDSINLDNVDNLTVELINKLDSAILGMHLFVMFKQPVSYLVASTEIDAKYLKKSVLTKVNLDEIRKNSPQLAQRIDGFIFRELGEIGNVGKVKSFFTHKSPLDSKILAGIKKFDIGTIGRIWNAVKLEIKDKYPDLTGEEYWTKVTERAEEVIRRTQPTWHPKDRSEIGRNKSVWIKLLTKYTSQRNKNRIILKRATLEYNRSERAKNGGHTGKAKKTLLKKYTTVLITSALLIEAINELRRRAYGNKSRSVWQIALAAIGTSLSTFYIVGDLFSSLISKIQKGTYAGYDTGNIVSSYVDNAIDGLTDTWKVIDELRTRAEYMSGDKKGELKYKTTALRALDKNASTLLALKGIPYNNIRNLIAGVWKMAGEKKEEETQPKIIGKPSISKISIPKISIGKIKKISPIKSKF